MHAIAFAFSFFVFAQRTSDRRHSMIDIAFLWLLKAKAFAFRRALFYFLIASSTSPTGSDRSDVCSRPDGTTPHRTDTHARSRIGTSEQRARRGSVRPRVPAKTVSCLSISVYRVFQPTVEPVRRERQQREGEREATLAPLHRFHRSSFPCFHTHLGETLAPSNAHLTAGASRGRRARR